MVARAPPKPCIVFKSPRVTPLKETRPTTPPFHRTTIPVLRQRHKRVVEIPRCKLLSTLGSSSRHAALSSSFEFPTRGKYTPRCRELNGDKSVQSPRFLISAGKCRERVGRIHGSVEKKTPTNRFSNIRSGIRGSRHFLSKIAHYLHAHPGG